MFALIYLCVVVVCENVAAVAPLIVSLFASNRQVYLSTKKRGGISMAYIICTVVFNCTESTGRDVAIC